MNTAAIRVYWQFHNSIKNHACKYFCLTKWKSLVLRIWQLLHFPIKTVHFLMTIKINPICWKSLENCKIWFILHIKCYLSENGGCLICCYLAPVNKNLCRVSFLIAHNRTSLSLIYGLLSCHKYLWILLRLFEANQYCRFKAAKVDKLLCNKTLL